MAFWRGGTKAVIRAPIGKVWNVTRDFASILDWTWTALGVPGLEISVEGESPLPGCVRTFTITPPGGDGRKILIARETLLEFDEERHSYKYSVEEHEVFRDYVATFALSSHGDGEDATLLEWTYEMKADESDPAKEAAVDKAAMTLYGMCIQALKKHVE